MYCFDHMIFAGSGIVDSRKPVNNTSWVSVVIATDYLGIALMAFKPIQEYTNENHS